MLSLALKASLAAVACGSAAKGAGPVATEPALTPTPPLPTLTPLPPTPTAPPPTPTTAPQPIQLVPPQIVQGGFAMVVLNEPATSATASFQGRQYPMLRSGQRSWALLGVGAFAQPQLYPVNVNYTLPSGGTATLVASLAVLDKDYPVENIDLDPQTSSLLAPDIVQAELARRATIYAGYTAQRLWSGPFVRPHAGPLSSVYGEARSYNRGPVTDYHRGNDFVGEPGTPVVASAAGRVAFTGELRVRGNSVIIDHGAGVFSAYHHLSRIDVGDGQAVTRGQQVGALGATGLVTGPHLHWEVVVRGVEVDGQLWLDGREYGL
jgi:murein DD-endopeptidase MepM/ murein hydrolase activator NlpD